MAIMVKARVLLELGAELISSDQIAIYELVKNSLDAGASRIEVKVHITLQRSDYLAARQSLERLKKENPIPTPEAIQAILQPKLELTAPQADRENLIKELTTAKPDELAEALDKAYVRYNWLEIKDDGSGMSLSDLNDIYLTVGTTNRLLERRNDSQKTVLGEKGIGRLSAVRLGDLLNVYTSQKGEKEKSELVIDWALIKNNPTLDINDFPAVPKRGGSKAKASEHGTIIRIANLTSEWSTEKLEGLAKTDFAKLVDPFQSSLSRPNIRLFFNEAPVEIPLFQSRQLTYAHARCSAQFGYSEDGEPVLSGEVVYKTYGQTKQFRLEGMHLWSALALKGKRPKAKGEPAPLAANLIQGLATLGPFTMEAHWFNRQKLRLDKPDGYETALNWLMRWGGGLLLYRDHYRVYPYAETRDDWLDLDGVALATGGYKMNRKQIVGAVQISSRNNPCLLDQTNREGLRDTEEKAALIALLRQILLVEFKSYLNAVEGAQDESAAKEFPKLEKRLDEAQKQALKQVQYLKTKVTDKEDVTAINTLLARMADISEAWEKSRATVRLYEQDIDKYVHLAGVGLMTEFIFHELGRLSANALKILQTYKVGNTSEGRKLKTLKDQLTTLERRIRVLDPLATPGRQRKEKFDLVQLLRDVIEIHASQFERHDISCDMSKLGNSKLEVIGVRGQFVQIIENFVANSTYWLKLQKQARDFKPQIIISINRESKEITFLDNGPGIPEDRGDEVFNAFFSTKPSGEGRGMGLYIAKKLAESNSLTLMLAEPDEERIHHGFTLSYGESNDGNA